MHIGVIFHQYVGAPFLNWLQWNTAHLEFTYVINFAKFGVDQSQGWGLHVWAVKYYGFAFTREALLNTALRCCAHCDNPV